MAKQLDTFLGANTPLGFVSLFDELYDPYGPGRTVILKGGPGTGKSTLMRRVARAAASRGLDVECAHCGSDPHSLDAVIVPAQKFAICDGTPPHVVEPKFPGASETIVNLGAFWNARALRENADEIRRLTVENSLFHRRATRFLAAAGNLSDELQAFCAPFVLEEKLNGYALRFCARELPKKKGAAPGTRKRRFFSGFTPDGKVFFEQTLHTLGTRLIALRDTGTGMGSRLLSYIETRARAAGFDVIAGLDPLHPKTGLCALAIPEASLALVALDETAPPERAPDRTVHMRRFFVPEFLREHKNFLAFQNSMIASLCEQNHLLLRQAKETHDRLEALYIPAMDFDALGRAAEEVCEMLDG